MGMKHALEVIARNGGKINGDHISILTQAPVPVRLEQAFEGLHPIEKRRVGKNLADEYTFEFEGTGFVVMGDAHPNKQSSWDYTGDFSFQSEVSVDGAKPVTAKFPANYRTRSNELFWKYQLPAGKHTVKIKVNNPDPEYTLRISEIIIYNNKPAPR